MSCPGAIWSIFISISNINSPFLKKMPQLTHNEFLVINAGMIKEIPNYTLD